MAVVLTTAQLNTAIASDFHDNTTRDITEGVVRETLYKINTRIVFTPYLEFRVYKGEKNTNNVLEVGDIAVGWISPKVFIPFGLYKGGNETDITSWDTSQMDFT